MRDIELLNNTLCTINKEFIGLTIQPKSGIPEEFCAKISNSLRKFTFYGERNLNESPIFLDLLRKYPFKYIEYFSCDTVLISEEILKSSQNTLRLLRCRWSDSLLIPILPKLEKLYLDSYSNFHRDIIELQKKFPNLREVFFDQCGWDNIFEAFLHIKTIQTIIVRSYNNSGITAQCLTMKSGPSTLKHLHLGALCTMKREGFLNVARACQNLQTFSVSYVTLEPEDVEEFRKLTPNLIYGRIKNQSYNNPGRYLLHVGEISDLPNSVQKLLGQGYIS